MGFIGVARGRVSHLSLLSSSRIPALERKRIGGLREEEEWIAYKSSEHFNPDIALM
jgi:hypothetical protein